MSPAGTSRRMCRKCGEEIGLGEKRCPNCGTLYKKRPEGITPFWWGVIIFIIAFGALLAYIISAPKKGSKAPAAPVPTVAVPTVAAPKAPAAPAPAAPAEAPVAPK